MKSNTIAGPFRYDNFRVLDASGRILARIQMSVRVSTDDLNRAGHLLASSWNLRGLLAHVLTCSGSPADCETCAEAAVNSTPKEDGPTNA